jgi:hypothetical protein
MVIAKYLTGSTPVTIQLAGFTPGATAQVFQLTNANVIQSLPGVPVSGSALSTTLPPQSVTLFVVPAAGGPPPPGSGPAFVTGAGEGGAALVHGFTGAGATSAPDLLVYPLGYIGGVRVGGCDFDGDGQPDLVTVAGPGGAPHVRIVKLDAAGTPGGDLANFFAYDPGFVGGLFVACGDVDGDSAPELILGVDAGGGPHVRVLKIAGGTVLPLVEFFAYDPGFRGGIRVAAGDVDGSGRAAIILGAGPGGGPHVRVLKYAGGGVLTELASFMVYDLGFLSGIYVAAGDVNGDGRADIITGVGAGGGPHVRVVTLPGGSAAPVELASFFAYDPGARAGMRVAAARLGPGDTRAAILTVPGPGSAPHLKAFRRNPDGSITEALGLFAYDPGFLGGAWVAGLR